MKRLLNLGIVLALAAQTALGAGSLNGAGATFPYPIYSKWFDVYGKQKGVEINYQSIGSGGGIRQVTQRTVDFGATDGPMSDDQLFAVDGKILHIPTVLGGVAVIYNLPNFTGEVKIDGAVLANIFLGKVKSWDDPSLAALNAGITLPSTPIVVVHRSDGSGTTFCFTDYLSKVSPEWKKQVNKGTSVKWPAGLGGKGNEGVAGTVRSTHGSIGYSEVIYAKQNNISFMAVKNKAGEFVKPSDDSITAAAAAAAKNMPADYRVSITDADGAGAYPVSTFTWLLVYEKNSGTTGTILRDFLNWMIVDGQKMAPELGYAPLPNQVVTMLKSTIQTIK